jgi:hypothetical protein
MSRSSRSRAGYSAGYGTAPVFVPNSDSVARCGDHVGAPSCERPITKHAARSRNLSVLLLEVEGSERSTLTISRDEALASLSQAALEMSAHLWGMRLPRPHGRHFFTCRHEPHAPSLLILKRLSISIFAQHHRATGTDINATTSSRFIKWRAPHASRRIRSLGRPFSLTSHPRFDGFPANPESHSTSQHPPGHILTLALDPSRTVEVRSSSLVPDVVQLGTSALAVKLPGWREALICATGACS